MTAPKPKRGPIDDDPAAEAGSTQQALADKAAKALRERVVWRQERNEWWLCSQTSSPGYWSAENREGVSEAVQNLVFRAKPEATVSTVDAVKRLLRPKLAKLPSDFDRRPLLLPAANGVVDLETFKLSPAEPRLFLTRSAPTAYDPKARAPMFEEHVLTMFAGDDELAGLFQRLVGSALVGDATMKPQVFVFLLGGSGRGKGTALRAITNALGEGQLVASFASEDFTAKGSGRHRQWLTRVNGARLAVVEEVRSDALDVAQLKRLSGGDTIIANEMRQADKAWRPTHTLFFTSNDEPNFGQDPAGMRRRYVPVPVNGPERDLPDGYEGMLAAEAAGILTWAIEGCRMWRSEGSSGGIALPSTVTDLRDAHISDHDPYEAFIESCLVVSPGAAIKCTRSEIQAAYRKHLFDSGDMTPVPERSPVWTRLYSKIGTISGVKSGTLGGKGSQERGWRGVCVNDFSEP